MANTRPKSLSDFASTLRKYDIARQSLFYINMTLPPALINKISMEELRIANLMCHATFTPEIQFTTINSYFEAGQPIERNHGYLQTPVTLWFHVDGNYIVKKLFDQWRRAITTSKNNYAWPDDYTADSLTLTMLNTSEKTIQTTTYKRVWPKEIAQISLDYSSGTGLQTFGVTFPYETIEFSTDSIDTNTLEVAVQREKLALQYANPELIA